MSEPTTWALRVAAVSKTFRPFRWPWQANAPVQDGVRHDTAEGRSGPVCALDKVSLQVRRGEIFGVLGPNGSGKSTLIRVIATLVLPDSGSVEVLGLDLARHELEIRRLINRVSVEASFFKKLSPLENLLFGARLYGLPANRARQEALGILRRLGLREASLWQPMEQMSRGMQQKVAIARALLTAPVLLLLDEPTTGLDPRSKREVQGLVEALRRDHHATVILTTHDMLEADALCDRVAIIDAGRIVAEGTPAELKQRVASTTGGSPPTLEDVFLALTGHSLQSADEAASEDAVESSDVVLAP
ncbi:MAG: ABC transporter ATP-binding protein [Fimbriimonadaceae bacterium]|nr:ABC transporter ATP-binding protein [Fimbriimonadaceae bacterium]